MSQSINRELDFFFYAMLVGAFIAVFYDTIRICRRVFKHGVFLVALEDFMFWFITCIEIFEMFIRKNSGTLRLFAMLASMLGMLVYNRTLSRVYVTYVSRLLKLLLEQLKRLIRWILKPVYLAGNTIKNKGGRGFRHLKNRLTKSIKLFIMVLCKR